MSRFLKLTGLLFALMFISMGFMEYPYNFGSLDPDFQYWIYKNRIKKFISSSERSYGQETLRYFTEYSFSQEGLLVEERKYIEFGNTSLEDTVPLVSDGIRFHGNRGVSYKRYLLNEKTILHQQSFDKKGDLLFSVFKNNDSHDQTILHGIILMQSIKYATEKEEIEISTFNLNEFNAAYFDTLLFVHLTKDRSNNIISVGSWIKNPNELNGYDDARKRPLYNAKKIVDTVKFDLQGERDYKSKLISTYGPDCNTIFYSCIVRSYFSHSVDWFSSDYGDDYDLLYSFSQERRYVFKNSNCDSSVVFHYWHPEIEVVAQNEIGKVIKRYWLYGPASSNTPEFNYYDQYNTAGKLIESYRLQRNVWHKTIYTYDNDLIKKIEWYRELPDSKIDTTRLTRLYTYDWYGRENAREDNHSNKPASTDPKTLSYVHVKSHDYTKFSRISFVGNSKDTITNFIVADSSGSVYTVEYW